MCFTYKINDSVWLTCFMHLRHLYVTCIAKMLSILNLCTCVCFCMENVAYGQLWCCWYDVLVETTSWFYLAWFTVAERLCFIMCTLRETSVRSPILFWTEFIQIQAFWFVLGHIYALLSSNHLRTRVYYNTLTQLHISHKPYNATSANKPSIIGWYLGKG